VEAGSGRPLASPSGRPLALGPSGAPLRGPGGAPLSLGPDGAALVCAASGAPLLGPAGRPLALGPGGALVAAGDSRPLLGAGAQAAFVGADGAFAVDAGAGARRRRSRGPPSGEKGTRRPVSAAGRRRDGLPTLTPAPPHPSRRGPACPRRGRRRAAPVFWQATAALGPR
jgi:hypothetical protein